MLKLYNFNDINLINPVAELQNASEVKVVREINGVYELSFKYPEDEKCSLIKENALIECEGQAFRIMRITNTAGEARKVYSVHVYNADSSSVYVPNVPDCIGVKPSDVIRLAFSGTNFTVLSDSELLELGMQAIDSDGFLMDFFSLDKTTPFDVMNEVIKNCGKGEVYIDNYKIALVERLGKDRAIRLTLEDNMSGISVETDMSTVVTRLHPYGYEDMHIGSVNGDCQHLDSPNITKYGVREGYRDYSDYRDPVGIMNRGLWEFDERNEERIDVPSINISGTVIDLARLSEYAFERFGLGDKVRVIYGGNTYYERVIRTEYFPFEPLSGSVSIGRVKRDLFFYLDQMGKLGKRYSKVTTSNGKVAASAISGVVSADGVKVKDSNGTVSVLSDMISMSDGSGLRFRCGVSSGEFVFDLYCNNKRALYVSGNQLFVNADQIQVKDAVLTSDDEGNLYVNGKQL